MLSTAGGALLRARGSAGMALSTLDMGIIVAYLVFAVGLGVYFSRTNKTTEAFFLGSRGLPGWALGLSLLSTSISSNTFLAIPSYSYASDFGLLLKDAVLPLVAVPAAVLFVPFFRQEGRIGEWQARKPWGRNRRRGEPPWGSAFEFLEDRFGPFCRRYAGVCYVCIQMVRTASILYLISIPVSLFTGLSGEFAIVSTGVCVPKPLLSPGRSRLTHAGAGEQVCGVLLDARRGPRRRLHRRRPGRDPPRRRHRHGDHRGDAAAGGSGDAGGGWGGGAEVQPGGGGGGAV